MIGEESASVKVPVAELTVAIQYIEDLVDLSIASTNSDVLERWRYMQFNLLNDLDFNENSSYRNPTSTEYGDLNENGTVEALKVEMTTGKGFVPIDTFVGVFNGNGNEIKNLYTVDRTGFMAYNYGTVLNLGLVVNYTSTVSTNIGGIAIYNDGVILNCHTDGFIETTAESTIGGIAVENSGCISNSYSNININSGNEDNVVFGICADDNGYLFNVYYGGTISGEAYKFYGIGHVSGINSWCRNGVYYLENELYQEEENCISMSDEEMKNDAFITTLNDKLRDEAYSSWATWKKTDKYPTFEKDEPILIFYKSMDMISTFDAAPDFKASTYLLGDFSNVKCLEIYNAEDNSLIETIDNYEVSDTLSINPNVSPYQGVELLYVKLQNDNGETIKSNILHMENW